MDNLDYWISFAKLQALRFVKKNGDTFEYLDTDDFIQEAQIFMLETLNSFDPSLFKSKEAFLVIRIRQRLTDLVRFVTKNRCKSFQKAEIDEIGVMPSINYDTAMLKSMVLSLTVKEYIVICLFYWCDYYGIEIAKVLGVSPGNISQVHKKAVKKIHDLFFNGKELQKEKKLKSRGNLKVKDVIEVRKRLADGELVKTIAQDMDINITTVYNIRKNIRYKKVKDEVQNEIFRYSTNDQHW